MREENNTADCHTGSVAPPVADQAY